MKTREDKTSVGADNKATGVLAYCYTVTSYWDTWIEQGSIDCYNRTPVLFLQWQVELPTSIYWFNNRCVKGLLTARLVFLIWHSFSMLESRSVFRTIEHFTLKYGFWFAYSIWMQFLNCCSICLNFLLNFCVFKTVLKCCNLCGSGHSCYTLCIPCITESFKRWHCLKSNAKICSVLFQHYPALKVL